MNVMHFNTASTQAVVQERVTLVDALRGFALMGLFIVHMVEYFELYWYVPEPGWVHNTIFFLFGGKAYALFALLFGFSFYVILNNQQARGVDYRGRFVWRLFLLVAMGYVHSLLYAGDILQILAVCGLPLVLFYSLSIRGLLVIALFFLIQVPHWVWIIASEQQWTAPLTQPQFIAYMGNNFEMYAHGSLSELVQYNFVEGQKGKWVFFVETGRLWTIFGLMFLGVVLGRCGAFTKPQAIRYWIAAGVLGAVGFVGFKWGVSQLDSTFTDTMARWRFNQVIGFYQNYCVIIAGMALFALSYQSAVIAKALQFWAAPGRLTLTFYILQSVIFVPLFYGFGAGWYEGVGQELTLAIGCMAWVTQMALAHLWVQHFRYGPLEWVWRKTTNIKLP